MLLPGTSCTLPALPPPGRHRQRTGGGRRLHTATTWASSPWHPGPVSC